MDSVNFHDFQGEKSHFPHGLRLDQIKRKLRLRHGMGQGRHRAKVLEKSVHASHQHMELSTVSDSGEEGAEINPGGSTSRNTESCSCEPSDAFQPFEISEQDLHLRLEGNTAILPLPFRDTKQGQRIQAYN